MIFSFKYNFKIHLYLNLKKNKKNKTFYSQHHDI